MKIEITYDDGQLTSSQSDIPTEFEGYFTEYLKKMNKLSPIGFYDNSPVYSLYQPPPATPSGIRSLENRLRRKTAGIRIPATATIAVNKACQCKCNHCSAVYYNHAQHPDLSSEQLSEAIQEACQLGVTTIILLGGEPLLKKNIHQIISSVPKDRANVILFTNGEYLTHKVCQNLKKAGLMGAFVSLDHHTSQKHDQFRKRMGLFSKAIKGIQNMRKAGLMVGISSHLSHTNLSQNHFENMVELGKSLSVNEITFFDAIPSGQWLHDTSEVLTPEDRRIIQSLTRKYRTLPKYPGLSVQSTMTCDTGSAFCFAANTQFYLTAWGEMCPCDFTPLSVGQYPNSSIKELWDKMISCEPYTRRSKGCRMQDAGFREQYLNLIPKEGPYPYPIDKLNIFQQFDC